MPLVQQDKPVHLTGKHGYTMVNLLPRKPVARISELAEYSQIVGRQEPSHDQPFQSNSMAPGRILISRSFIPLSPIELLAHCASLAFSAAVLWLCGSDTYFKDTNTPNINSILSTFQFVAALHTSIVAASLTAMAVYHLQYELCVAAGLPIGYIAFPFQLSSITNLLQPRFRRALLSDSNTRRKQFFGLGILLAVVLQALMNPSSAILIVPQLGWWSRTDAFGTTDGYSYINASYGSLWPDRLNATHAPAGCNTTQIGMPEQCLYTSMIQIRQWTANYLGTWAAPNITIVSGAGIVRYLGASPVDNHGYSAASTPHVTIGANFGSFWLYALRLGTLPFTTWASPRISLFSDPENPIMRPLVQVQCNPPTDITKLNATQYRFQFPANLIKTSSGISLPNVTAAVNVTDYKTRYTRIDFKDLTTEAGQPTLGVVASLAFYHPDHVFSGANDSSIRFGLMTCTTASHWIPTNLSTDPTVQNVVIMDHADPIATLAGKWFKKHARPVEVSLDFAQHINIPVTNSTNTVLEYEMKGTQTFGAYDGTWEWRWPWEVATVVSMQLSDALARVHAVHSPVMVFCKGCRTGGYLGNPDANTTRASYVQDLGSQNDDVDGKRYTNSTPHEWATEIKSRPDLYTPVRWEILRYGYGWTLSKAISWMSVTVIGLHAILVFAHVTTMIARHIRFDAWDDLTCLLSLASRSDPVEALSNLGCDVRKSEVYAQNVKVRAFVGEGGFMDAMLTDVEDDALGRQRPAMPLEIGTHYR